MQCKTIPFINNAILVPIRPKLNTTLLTNIPCDQCLCSALRNSLILAINCYANSTCELFTQYPRTYQYQSSSNSRIYFPQSILPNASNPCCMSNTTLLLQKLQNAANPMINVTITQPRCLLIDNNGSLVTIEQISNGQSYFDRLDPQTLTLLEHIPINAMVANIGHYQDKFYIGINNNNTISVFKKGQTNNSLVYLTNINGGATPMKGVRDIIFLNNGSTMVVASADNNCIYYYAVVNDTYYPLINYTTVNYNTPHGLFPLNDSFYYVAAWSIPSIYSYKYNTQSANWTQSLFATAPAPSAYGAHIFVDDCNRRWFTVYGYGIRIYDANGASLGNWSIGGGYFDALLLDNYVLILSNSANSKLTRIDPQVTCD
ncbi:unnamed protein product [Adineta ricciae]|uniref:Uncharacterized protein n=2 Tax=Adineta ricciae TaxID=249248 RepID=A0A814MA42_ADIRI|nr:unnamed protein product [Adineta ricciae]